MREAYKIKKVSNCVQAFRSYTEMWALNGIKETTENNDLEEKSSKYHKWHLFHSISLTETRVFVTSWTWFMHWGHYMVSGVDNRSSHSVPLTQ